MKVKVKLTTCRSWLSRVNVSAGNSLAIRVHTPASAGTRPALLSYVLVLILRVTLHFVVSRLKVKDRSVDAQSF